MLARTQLLRLQKSSRQEKRRLSLAGLIRPISRQETLLFVSLVALLALLAIVTLPSFAQSETLSLSIDPQPLFDSIESYVPLFFGILAVAGGILIGKRIAEFVIKSIADAF